MEIHHQPATVNMSLLILHGSAKTEVGSSLEKRILSTTPLAMEEGYSIVLLVSLLILVMLKQERT